MSSREPLWFCHECHAEMRPLMAPDPVCASCRGSFVEKMEDPADDPREFAQSDPGDMGGEGMPPGIDNFLLALQTLMDRGMTQEGRTQAVRGGLDGGTSGNRFTFEIRRGSGQPPSTTLRSGNGASGEPLTMNEFLRRGPDTAGTTGGGAGGITGPLMAQYLMALLGHRDPLNTFLGGDPATPGRMGDYVFNQEALDQIITQLMDNSNTHRPVPATEEIISNLPREVLEQNSPMLERDCAVCKEQFKLDTEDPDEQIVVTLPCKHPFHEPCILPWLKSSGTCPVCRHALVPQPEHHPPIRPDPSSGDSSRPTSPSSGNRNRSPRRDGGPDAATGFLQSLFGGIVGGGSNNASPSSSRHARSNSDPAASRSQASQQGQGNGNFPGSWSEDLD